MAPAAPKLSNPNQSSFPQWGHFCLANGNNTSEPTGNFLDSRKPHFGHFNRAASANPRKGGININGNSSADVLGKTNILLMIALRTMPLTISAKIERPRVLNDIIVTPVSDALRTGVVRIKSGIRGSSVEPYTRPIAHRSADKIAIAIKVNSQRKIRARNRQIPVDKSSADITHITRNKACEGTASGVEARLTAV